MVIPTFIDQCLLGYTKISSIGKYIEEWHTGKYSYPLHQFLGMTEEEYHKWATDDSYLTVLIKNRLESNISNDFKECIICKGTGYDCYDRSYPPDRYICDECNGTGKVTKDKFIEQFIQELALLEKQLD